MNLVWLVKAKLYEFEYHVFTKLMVFNSYDFKVNSVVQVHKDHKAPFFMSGCKVADGVGVMLV